MWRGGCGGGRGARGVGGGRGWGGGGGWGLGERRREAGGREGAVGWRWGVGEGVRARARVKALDGKCEGEMSWKKRRWDVGRLGVGGWGSG